MMPAAKKFKPSGTADSDPFADDDWDDDTLMKFIDEEVPTFSQMTQALTTDNIKLKPHPSPAPSSSRSFAFKKPNSILYPNNFNTDSTHTLTKVNPVVATPKPGVKIQSSVLDVNPYKISSPSAGMIQLESEDSLMPLSADKPHSTSINIPPPLVWNSSKGPEASVALSDQTNVEIDKKVQDLTRKQHAAQGEIKWLRSNVTEKDKQIADLRNSFTNESFKLKQASETEIKGLRSEVEKMRSELHFKTSEVNSLTQSLTSLKKEKTTRGPRLSLGADGFPASTSTERVSSTKLHTTATNTESSGPMTSTIEESRVTKPLFRNSECQIHERNREKVNNLYFQELIESLAKAQAAFERHQDEAVPSTTIKEIISQLRQQRFTAEIELYLLLVRLLDIQSLASDELLMITSLFTSLALNSQTISGLRLGQVSQTTTQLAHKQFALHTLTKKLGYPNVTTVASFVSEKLSESISKLLEETTEPNRSISSAIHIASVSFFREFISMEDNFSFREKLLSCVVKQLYIKDLESESSLLVKTLQSVKFLISSNALRDIEFCRESVCLVKTVSNRLTRNKTKPEVQHKLSTILALLAVHHREKFSCPHASQVVPSLIIYLSQILLSITSASNLSSDFSLNSTSSCHLNHIQVTEDLVMRINSGLHLMKVFEFTMDDISTVLKPVNMELCFVMDRLQILTNLLPNGSIKDNSLKRFKDKIIPTASPMDTR